MKKQGSQGILLIEEPGRRSPKKTEKEWPMAWEENQVNVAPGSVVVSPGFAVLHTRCHACFQTRFGALLQ